MPNFLIQFNSCFIHLNYIFNSEWSTAKLSQVLDHCCIFQRSSYIFLLTSLYTLAIAIAIVSSPITGVSFAFMIHHFGPGEQARGVIDRLVLDRARSTLHVQYFLITLYTVLLEVGPRRTSGSWTGAPLRRGEGGENGPTEGARRGNCAPTSGSPVAPSRTCRLFPRRDSRSPHLSSVRLASLNPPPPLFSPLRLWPSHHRRHTCAPRVRGQGARHAYLFLDIFRSATREIHPTCTWSSTNTTCRYPKSVTRQRRKSGRILDAWTD